MRKTDQGELKKAVAITCVRGDGQPYVKVSFSELQGAQDFHATLIDAMRRPETDQAEPVTHLLSWLDDGWTHCQHGTKEWCESYLHNARDVIASSQGYVDAFYQIAAVLGIPAQNVSPKQVFEEQILPRLATPVPAQAVEATPEVKALVEALDQLLDDMGEDGQCVCLAAKEQAQVALAAWLPLAPNGASS